MIMLHKLYSMIVCFSNINQIFQQMSIVPILFLNTLSILRLHIGPRIGVGNFVTLVLSVMLCIKVLCSASKYCEVHQSTVQCIKVPRSASKYCTVHQITVQCIKAVQCIKVLCNASMYCAVHQSSVQYIKVLCTAILPTHGIWCSWGIWFPKAWKLQRFGSPFNRVASVYSMLVAQQTSSKLPRRYRLTDQKFERW